MSRSRQKSPVFPIVGARDHSDKQKRSEINRAVRHTNKIRVAQGDEPLMRNELPCDDDWDVHNDGSMRWYIGASKKAMRK